MNHQAGYWNRVAHEKTFTHPIDVSLLENYAGKAACIVDYGCGYGRILQELNKNGYTNIQGYDFSVELINRATKNGVEHVFQIDGPENLPYNDGTVDCFLLFAVLTCIPENRSQWELINVLLSKLKSGGIVYISDYYLQSNSNEMDRYEYLNNDAENYGVFALPEGVTFRHHTKEWIQKLLKDFEIKDETLVEVKTMNGSNAVAFQIIAQKL